MKKTTLTVTFGWRLVIVLLTVCLAACNNTPSPTQSPEQDLPDAKSEHVNLRFTIWSANEAHLAWNQAGRA